MTFDGTAGTTFPDTTVQTTAPISVGVGQTWQNVIGSRAFGTTYTNSTGKPIQLAVNAGGGTSANVSFNINGTGNVQFAQISGGYGQCYCVVPNGQTYAINSIVGSNNLGAWYELR